MDMAEDVNLVLVPDMEWEWAWAPGGKLKPSFNLLRKGRAYGGISPDFFKIFLPGIRFLRSGASAVKSFSVN
jgi:hypothetical protein